MIRPRNKADNSGNEKTEEMEGRVWGKWVATALKDETQGGTGCTVR